MKRIAGLDQLRFILAICVLLPHCNLVPDFSGQPRGSLVQLGLRVFADNLINPVAAVIVFFIISGFCIHLPYRSNAAIPIVPYFTRRFVRILIPMGAAVLLARPLGLKLPVFNDSILWSLVCEEIYYLLYPLLRRISFRYGWIKMFTIAFIVAFGLGLLTIRHNDVTQGIYPAYGPSLTWLLGLPCWLLGCILAEKYDSFETIPTSLNLWSWRFVIWSIAFVCSVLKFHSPLGYPVTLNLFALVAYFWLKREIAFYRNRKPVRLFERGGAWSYSIYLTHLHAQELFVLIGIPAVFLPLNWVIHLMFLLSICYLFYRIFEKPSHRLARHLSNVLGRKTTYQNGPAVAVLSDATVGE